MAKTFGWNEPAAAAPDGSYAQVLVMDDRCPLMAKRFMPPMRPSPPVASSMAWLAFHHP